VLPVAPGLAEVVQAPGDQVERRALMFPGHSKRLREIQAQKTRAPGQAPRPVVTTRVGVVQAVQAARRAQLFPGYLV